MNRDLLHNKYTFYEHKEKLKKKYRIMEIHILCLIFHHSHEYSPGLLNQETLISYYISVLHPHRFELQK